MSHSVETTPIPDTEVDCARNLLAGALDAPLPDMALLAVSAAYSHLEDAGHGLWPPPRAAHVGEPAAALRQARSLLADARDECVDGLDRYGLAMAVREMCSALALLDGSVSGP
jgi:hypothetical protein